MGQPGTAVGAADALLLVEVALAEEVEEVELVEEIDVEEALVAVEVEVETRVVELDNVEVSVGIGKGIEALLEAGSWLTLGFH